MRYQLKMAVVRLGVPQYVVAKRAGLSETRLSRIVQGRLQPTPDERRRLARVLGASENELFGAQGANSGGDHNE